MCRLFILVLKFQFIQILQEDFIIRKIKIANAVFIQMNPSLRSNNAGCDCRANLELVRYFAVLCLFVCVLKALV